MKRTTREALAMLVGEIAGYQGAALERAIYGVIGAAHAFQATGAIDMNEALLWGHRARLAGVRKGWVVPPGGTGLTEEELVARIAEAERVLPPPPPLDEAPPAPGEARLTPLPDGLDGIRWTAGRMIRMIQDARKDALVIALARKIAAVSSDPPGPDARGQELHWLRGIHAWCRANFQFVNDPPGIEVIQTPGRMLRELQIPAELHTALWAPIGKATGVKLPDPKMTGDADEATIISMALAAAAGIEPLRIALGGTEDVIHTCWGQAKVIGKWVDFDVLHEKFGKHQAVREIEHLDVPL